MEAPDRPPPGQEVAAELKRLRRESEILRRERDILKKATAFFVRDWLRPKRHGSERRADG